MMKRVLQLLLQVIATSAFAPAAHHHHPLASTIVLTPQSKVPSLLPLNGASFDDYSQSEPDQDLAYQDIVVGDGDIAENGKVVTVAYKGSLMSNGKTFDEGQIPFRLGDGKVISGWEQGINGMKVGGKRVLKIPPKLAYGDRGAGSIIPGGAHLVFDCELKAVANGPFEEAMAELSKNPFNLLALVAIVGNIIYVALGTNN